MPAGPSPDYIAPLRGEITSAEYVRRLKLTVDKRLKKHGFRQAKCERNDG